MVAIAEDSFYCFSYANSDIWSRECEKLFLHNKYERSSVVKVVQAREKKQKPTRKSRTDLETDAIDTNFQLVTSGNFTFFLRENKRRVFSCVTCYSLMTFEGNKLTENQKSKPIVDWKNVKHFTDGTSTEIAFQLDMNWNGEEQRTA